MLTSILKFIPPLKIFLWFIDLSFSHRVVSSIYSQVGVCFSKRNANTKVDVKALDVFFNLTSASTQLMNGKVPWRSGREKDSESIQILIEALTTPTSIVLDAYASTCRFISYSRTYYIISQCVLMKSL